ncbi:MAG: hypothetical protein LC775_07245, partial [Acidobacteria bacterium]|nr:hypothetical protein [Acidobacteriota bacterium]
CISPRLRPRGGSHVQNVKIVKGFRCPAAQTGWPTIARMRARFPGSGPCEGKAVRVQPFRTERRLRGQCSRGARCASMSSLRDHQSRETYDEPGKAA